MFAFPHLQATVSNFLPPPIMDDVVKDAKAASLDAEVVEGSSDDSNFEMVGTDADRQDMYRMGKVQEMRAGLPV